MKKVLVALSILIAALAPLTAHAQTAVTWLCPPTGPATCQHPTRITTVPLIGASRTATTAAAPSPTVDCFYLYPTISSADSYNAPLVATTTIRNYVRTATTPFSSSCRIVVPVYAQVTATYLSLSPTVRDRRAAEVAYQSVVAAWRAYMAATPSTRPVALVGFSQGAAMASQLLRREISTHPAELQRIVVAILVGGTVTLTSPRSAHDGLGGLARCGTIASFRCAYSYDAFTVAPRSGAAAGVVGAPWMYLDGVVPASERTSCTNPVYGGTADGPLIPLLPQADGGYLTYVNRFRAVCLTANSTTYLNVRQITVPGSPTGRNPQPELPSDAGTSRFGLHRLEWDLSLGNIARALHSAIIHWDLRH